MRNRQASEVIKGQTVVTVSPQTTVRDAAVAMRDAKVGSVMVTSGGRLVGIFTERDALYRVLAAGLNPDNTPVSAVATAQVMTASPDMPILQVLHLMHEGNFRHVPVVEQGKPLGMVSLRDALGAELDRFRSETERKRDLAEIVG